MLLAKAGAMLADIPTLPKEEQPKRLTEARALLEQALRVARASGELRVIEETERKVEELRK
jgi:hypothetical protein